MIEIYYKDFNPRVGDIGIVSSKSWISRIIKKVTHSIVNHAFLFVGSKNNPAEIVVIEAEKKGIETNSFFTEKYEGGNNSNKQIYILRPNFDIDIAKFNTLAHSFNPVKYDFFGLIHQLILQKTGYWIGRKLKANNRFYCSEYVAYIYNQLYNLFPEWYKMNPKNILRDYDKKKFVLIKIVKD